MFIETPEKQDRRNFERFPARFPTRFKDTRDDFGTNVFLRDACAEGVKVTTRERLFLNDSVSLEIDLPDEREPLTLKGQVVWAVTGDIPDLWDVGIKFHKLDFVHLSRLYKFIAESS